MSLESFFNPKSVAVVGVSSDPAKLGSVVFLNLIDAKFSGNLYAINPKSAGQKLYDKPCYASVKDCPEAVDLVVIVVPAKFTMGAIDDCIANGTKNVSIITAGFGHSKSENRPNDQQQVLRPSTKKLSFPAGCVGTAVYKSRDWGKGIVYADYKPQRRVFHLFWVLRSRYEPAD